MTASYEDAEEQVREALVARSDLARFWKSLSESAGFSSHVVDDGDGAGRIVVELHWPAKEESAAEAAARRFVEHLKRALDLAVHATASHVSGVEAGPYDEAGGFPLCRLEADFVASLEAGALRGLRLDQVLFVEQLQPYDSRTSAVHVSLRQLATMLRSDRPASIQRLAVWAHSARPAVRSRPRGIVRTCTSTGDGLLVSSRTVARFTYEPVLNPSFTANPDIAFDPIFNDEPSPTGPDDNLMSRSALLVAAVRAVIRGLRSSMEISDTGRRSFANALDPQPPSPWGPMELPDSDVGRQITEALESSNIGLGVFTDADGKRVMLLRVDDGVRARPVPEALPLNVGEARGPAAEAATLAAASVWGLPDFVMRPRLVTKGDGVREIGDGTIIVGRLGLAVQVKSRSEPTENIDRESRWLAKKAREGASQASGTIRTLQRQTVTLVNGRGRDVECDGRQVDWARIVIIDHPSLPPDQTFADDIEAPLVVLLRRDWDFLFDQLRSTSAVAEYLHRVSRYEPQPIGEETVRYFELAQADEDTAPQPPPSWIDGTGATHFSGPRLPKAPANATDSHAHGLFRVLLDDIASCEIDGNETERLAMLAQIDRFGVGHRAELGRLLIGHLDDVTSVARDTTKWRFRRVVQDDGELQLAFGACTTFSDQHREAFRQWTLLRHHEFVEVVDRDQSASPATVAVLLTPRRDGVRPWDTTVVAVEGRVDLEEDELEAMRQLWAPRHMDVAS